MALKDNYVTITEAAKQLGVTRQTISRWIAKKYVPAERVGRVALIKKKDLHKYHKWRLSEAFADRFIDLYLGTAEDYFREKGRLEEGQHLEFADLKEVREGKVKAVSGEDKAEIDRRVRPVLTKMLKELRQKTIKEMKEGK
ncbi:hypothetical protein ES703_69062 [subsurface metagenome]